MIAYKPIFHEGLALIQLDDRSEISIKKVPPKALLEIKYEGEKLSDCISFQMYEQYRHLSSTESFDLYFESQL